MAKRIYSILGVLALGIMFYLIDRTGGDADRTMIWVITLLYAVMVGCIHGIISHSLKARQKGSLIFYPVMMGILFGVLALVYFYLVLPLITPSF